MALDAATRAPTVDEEYETLMWGDGNPQGFSALAPMPTSPGDSDGDHRLRLYKAPEEYLARWIPIDFHVDGLFVGVGDIQSLNRISRYQWRNIDEQTHVQANFPFWQAWEIGGEFGIKALGVKNNTGSPYPLQPSLNPDENRDVMSMTKEIPRKQMFGGIGIESIVDKILIPAIDKIVREAR